MTDRPLPQNPEAERAVLGSILIQPSSIWQLTNLSTEHFAREQHRTIYATMLELSEDQATLDLVTLKDRLAERKELDKAGGAAYLSSLVDGIPDIANVRKYAAIVREHSHRRLVIREAARVEAKAWDGEDPAPLMRELAGMADRFLVDTNADTVTAAQMASSAFSRLEERIERVAAGGRGFDGVPTGVRPLDGQILGWEPALVIVGGRTSAGKSLLTMDSALSIAERGEEVLYLGIDMPPSYYHDRFLWMLAHRIRPGFSTRWHWMEGKIEMDQLRVAAEAKKRLSALPIRLNTSRRHVAMIAAEVRRAKRDWSTKIVFLDHFGKVESDTKGKQWERGQEETSRLATLAAEEEIPIVMLAQMARGSAETTAPKMSELRKSGSSEEDARTVLLVDRPYERREAVKEHRDAPDRESKDCDFVVYVGKRGEMKRGYPIHMHANLNNQRITGHYELEGYCSDCKRGPEGDNQPNHQGRLI